MYFFTPVSYTHLPDMQVAQRQLVQRSELLRRFAQNVVSAGVHRDLADAGHGRLNLEQQRAQPFKGQAKGVAAQQKESGLVPGRLSEQAQLVPDLVRGKNAELVARKVAEAAAAPAGAGGSESRSPVRLRRSRSRAGRRYRYPDIGPLGKILGIDGKVGCE